MSKDDFLHPVYQAGVMRSLGYTDAARSLEASAETIRLYREQIAYLKAELERASLLVAIHHTPAERIHALKTEWAVVDDMGVDGTIRDTLTDALALKAEWDRSQPGIRHQIQYRHTTPWRTISEAQ